jgi:signal transduction histidine kinase
MDRGVVRDPDFAGRLVEGLRTGLLAVDREGCVAALSEEGGRILGLPRDSLGRPAAVVLQEQPEIASLLGEALAGREPPSRAELALRASPHTAQAIGFTLVALRDERGAPDGAAMWFRDLTPFERRDAQDRLRDRLAALGQMAAGLAHELRNPLASLELLGGLLKRRVGEDPEASELVEEVLVEVRTLAAAVDASLASVRSPAPEPRPVRLEDAFDASLACARAAHAFAGQVERRCPADLLVHADPDQLRTVLDNLIANALIAMAGEGTPVHGAAGQGAVLLLAAEASSDGSGIEIVVEDNGPGVPPELRERIFYPFFTTRPEGSGVGLAEVQKLIVGHGGSVAVEPAVAGGARFVIHLPCASGVGTPPSGEAP